MCNIYNMQKKIGFFLLGFLFFVGAGCAQKTPEENKSVTPSSSFDVAVSIYPLAHFIQKVGGEKVNLHLITPGGVEPHDYEPTPADIIQIQSSKAFVFNGAGVDTWAESLQDDLIKKGVTSLEMVHYMEENLETSRDEGTDGDHEEDSHQDEHGHGEFDPHIWLDPVLAQKQVEVIVQLLVGIDPQNKNTYEKNGAEYIAQLIELDQEYKMRLSECSLRDIVVSHDAFQYLGKRYNIEIHPIAGLSPDEEPSAARLAELSRLMKEKNITTVFFETLVTPKLAETLAKEVGASTLVLNPLEGLSEDQNKNGKDYDILMKENLNNLRMAMLCQ